LPRTKRAESAPSADGFGATSAALGIDPTQAYDNGCLRAKIALFFYDGLGSLGAGQEG